MHVELDTIQQWLKSLGSGFHPESKDVKESTEAKESKASKDIKELKDSKELKDVKELNTSKDSKEVKESNFVEIIRINLTLSGRLLEARVLKILFLYIRSLLTMDIVKIQLRTLRS